MKYTQVYMPVDLLSARTVSYQIALGWRVRWVIVTLPLIYRFSILAVSVSNDNPLQEAWLVSVCQNNLLQHTINRTSRKHTIVQVCDNTGREIR